MYLTQIRISSSHPQISASIRPVKTLLVNVNSRLMFTFSLTAISSAIDLCEQTEMSSQGMFTLNTPRIAALCYTLCVFGFDSVGEFGIYTLHRSAAPVSEPVDSVCVNPLYAPTRFIQLTLKSDFFFQAIFPVSRLSLFEQAILYHDRQWFVGAVGTCPTFTTSLVTY